MHEEDRRVVPPTRCDTCGDVIGVYEPMVCRSPRAEWVTSLIAEPSIPRSDVACHHLDCASSARAAGDPG